MVGTRNLNPTLSLVKKLREGQITLFIRNTDMKIGVDIRALDTPYSTGIDTYLRKILENWYQDSREHQLILFGTPRLSQNYLVNALSSHGHKFIPQPWPNKFFNASLTFFNRPYIDYLLGKPEVIFLPNTMFHAFSRAAKTVLTFHDLSFVRLKPIYSFKRNLWHRFVNPEHEAKSAHNLIAVSNSTAHDLEVLYGISKEKINIIPLGIEYEYFNLPSKDKLDLPENYLLFLGSIEPRKNVSVLIEAMSILEEKYPNLHLVLAGSVFPEKDKQVFDRIKKNNKIKVMGPVKESEKVELYKRAAVTILPSLYEGFGLPILESFASGTPTIASVSSSMPEVSSGVALLVNPLNVNELAQGVEVLLTNDRLRNSLISRGREIAKQYSWAKTASLTLDLLEKTARS